MFIVKKIKIDNNDKEEEITKNIFFEKPNIINNYCNMKKPDLYLISYLDKLYKKNSNYDIWYSIYNLLVIFNEDEYYKKEVKYFLGTFFVLAHKYWEDDYLFLDNYEMMVAINRNKIRQIEFIIIQKLLHNIQDVFRVDFDNNKNENKGALFLEKIKELL
jgi:hypothetical protein